MSAVGIIGGSGLYSLEGLSDVSEFSVKTPFGDPSGPLVRGVLGGREVYFVARHGQGHRIAPHEINHRANIWALRSHGVRYVLAVTAVGSLREELHPGEAVVPDQLLDRLSRRDGHTFFGDGIVAHVGFADPYSAGLRRILVSACADSAVPCTDGGTYVCMDGPAFSTRAESHAYRQLGGAIIGMTNLPEAKLAREAGIALATLAMVTDYDCWKTDAPPVTADLIVARLRANVEASKKVLASALPMIPETADWPEHAALKNAMVTPQECWPAETVKKLDGILADFVR